MLVSIPPYMSVAQFVGTLKSKSALMIFDRHANLKYKYGNRNLHFFYIVSRNKNLKGILIEFSLPECYHQHRITYITCFGTILKQTEI